MMNGLLTAESRFNNRRARVPPQRPCRASASDHWPRRDESDERTQFDAVDRSRCGESLGHPRYRRWAGGQLTAREASRNGLRSLLVDKASFPRFKVCGGCLNAWALDTLGRVGLADALRRLGAQPIHEIEIIRVQSTRLVVPLPTGLSVSRAAFDEMLIGSAIEAGAGFSLRRAPGRWRLPARNSSDRAAPRTAQVTAATRVA